MTTFFLFHRSLVPVQAGGRALPDTFVLLFLVFLSFVAGVALQSLSTPLERIIFWIKYRERFPSAVILNPKNKMLSPRIKESIRSLAESHLGVSASSTSQEIFEICYAYTKQKEIGKTADQFLSMYSFCRNTTVAMVVELILLVPLVTVSPVTPLALSGLLGLTVFLAVLFGMQFIRYAETFAKQVLKTVYLDLSVGPCPRP